MTKRWAVNRDSNYRLRKGYRAAKKRFRKAMRAIWTEWRRHLDRPRAVTYREDWKSMVKWLKNLSFEEYIEGGMYS